MRKMVLTLLSIMPVMLAGCGDSGTGPSSTTPDWFPMQVGTIWSFDLSGTIAVASGTIDVTGGMDMEATAEVQHSEGFTVFEVLTVSEVTFTPEGGGASWTENTTDTTYVHVTDTAVEEYTNLDDTEPGTMLELPLEVGDSWYYETGGDYVETVLSLSESVTVPAGTYSPCAYVQETIHGESTDNYYANFFYADGTGPVKMVVHSVTLDETDDLEFDRS